MKKLYATEGEGNTLKPNKPTGGGPVYAARPIPDEATERAEEQAHELEAVASALAWCIGVTLVISAAFWWGWA